MYKTILKFIILFFLYSTSLFSQDTDYTVQLIPSLECEKEKFHLFVFKQSEPQKYIYHIESYKNAKVQISLKKNNYLIEAISKKGCSAKIALTKSTNILKLKASKNETIPQ